MRFSRVGAAIMTGAALLAAVLVPSVGAQEIPPGTSDDVRINEIQVIGSHNSYKRMVTDEEQELVRGVILDGADLMAYEHEPLGVQFGEQNVRQIELDVFVDREGGKYSSPLLWRLVFGEDVPYEAAMAEPGIKVLHVQDVDYASTCLSLVACLQDVKAWSDANPTHVPIGILVELKEDPVPVPLDLFVEPDPWTVDDMNALDAEIRSVFPPEQIITPDDVRGSHDTLRGAIVTDGWPTLGESRGKVMFHLDNTGGHRVTYTDGHPSLRDRIMFVSAPTDAPEAGFVKHNSPNESAIRALVEQGFIVRTRADSDTIAARENDTTNRDAALASGAQYVSTDYPMPNMGYGFETDYVAQIPGGTPARCNPVVGPEWCVSANLEVPAPPSTTTTTTTTLPDGSTSTSSTSTTSVPAPTTTVVPSSPTTDQAPTSTQPGTSTTDPPAVGDLDASRGPGSAGSSRAPAARPIRATPVYTG